MFSTTLRQHRRLQLKNFEVWATHISLANPILLISVLWIWSIYLFGLYYSCSFSIGGLLLWRYLGSWKCKIIVVSKNSYNEIVAYPLYRVPICQLSFSNVIGLFAVPEFDVLSWWSWLDLKRLSQCRCHSFRPRCQLLLRLVWFP